MLRKIRRQRRRRLLKLLCLGAAIATANLSLPQIAAAAVTTTRECFRLSTYPELNWADSLHRMAHIADDIAIANGHLTALASGSPLDLSLNGNVTITQDASAGYALFANAFSNGSNSNASATLTINAAGDKTVKITGNVKASGFYDVPNNARGNGTVALNLTNADSYLAGKLLRGGNLDYDYVFLTLKNGATWYVPDGDNAYTLVSSANTAGIHLALAGGIVDLYHTTPGIVRSAAGTRTFSLNNTGSSANGATFRLSSNIAANTADSVALTGVTGSNTYYVQVAYDPVVTTANTYTTGSVNGVTVLTATASDSGANTVTAASYTTTKDIAAGLTTKSFRITPMLATTTAGNLTTAQLTGLTVEDYVVPTNTGTPAGPAQKMANASAAASEGAMSSWRAENNDLLRRMGELREDDGQAGAWGRLYGGETDINTSSQTSTLNYRGLQIGCDRKINLREGKLFTGYTLSHMDGDVSYNSGGGDTDSTMMGVYGSYLGAKGHFADVILKYGHLQNSFSTTSNSVLYEGDNSANGLNMSLEYGYHQELENSWYLEPQAELNYGHINSSDYTMKMNGADGAQVHNNAMDSLIGRVGVNIGKKTSAGNIYAKLSLAREFAGDVGLTTSYGTYSNASCESMKDTWLEYGIGFNTKVSKIDNLYGEISKTTGDKAVDKWKADIGYRHSF